MLAAKPDYNGAVAELEKFPAFMTTKDGALYPFLIQVGGGELQIATVQKSIVKKQINLATVHAKLLEQTVRDSRENDDDSS